MTMRFSNSFGYAVKRRDAMGNLIPKEGLALLVMPGAQMIENSEKNKPFRPLVIGDENVNNSTFNNFTFDYPSIGEASPFYTSDFSVDANGWSNYQGLSAVDGNIDGISDGTTSYDDVLRLTSDGSNSVARAINHVGIITKYQYIRVGGKVYIPSGQVVDGAKVSIGNVWDLVIITTTVGSWVEFDVELQYTDKYDLGDIDYIQLIGSNFDNAGDVIYFKDIKVQRVGMVAHWVFDDYYHAQEGTGKTALQDLTANGHDLTASAGFDWENQFDGDNPAYKNGNAERFDGVDDEFHIAGDDFTPYSNDFSVAFWFNTSVGDGQYHMIAETYNGATTNWQLIVEPTYNKLRAVFSGDVASQSLFSLSPVNDGNWHLGIMVRSGTNLYLFVDGVQVASAPIDIGSIKDINNLNIGSRGGSSYFFNGYLSEGAYFNRALSANEVKALYAKAYGWDWDEIGDLQNDNFKQVISGGGTLTQDVTTLDNTLYEEQLVGEGINNIDYFGETTSHTVTLTDGTWTSASVKEVTNVDEIPNFVDDFSKGGAEYAEQLIDGTFESGSLDGWDGANATLSIDNSSQLYGINSLKATISSSWFNIHRNNTVEAGNMYLISFDVNVNVDVFGWHFVVYRGSAGASLATGETLHHLQEIDANGIYHYEIAIQFTDDEPTSQFIVIETYSPSINITGDVYFDNISIKKVSNGNHGIANGGLETGQPVHPYSWEFDGVDDYIDFGDVLNISTHDAILCAWVNTTATSGVILSKASTFSNGNKFYALRLYNGSFSVVMDGVTKVYIVNDGFAINDGNWHFVAAVLDRDGYLKRYVDGESYGTDVLLDEIQDLTNSNKFLIGARDHGPDNYFQGKLADIPPYIFDGQNGRPALLPTDSESRYITRIYNKTNKYFEE